MPVPEEYPKIPGEDLEDPLQFRIKFETEKWRLITNEDGKPVFVGAMIGLLGGTSINAYLHSDSGGTISSLNPVRETLRQPVLISENLFNRTALAATTPNVSGQINQPQVQQTITAIPPHEASTTTPSNEYQIAGILGVVGIVTFAAAAAHSAFRYWKTQRSINFKSSVDEFQLRNHYRSPDYAGPNN